MYDWWLLAAPRAVVVPAKTTNWNTPDIAFFMMHLPFAVLRVP